MDERWVIRKPPDQLARVQAAQDAMLGTEIARSYYGEVKREALRVVVRIVVQVHDYLRVEDLSSPSTFELGYHIQEVFCGVEFLQSVASGYGCLVGAVEKSGLEWRDVSVPGLREEYLRVFRAFDSELDFLRKFRLLLDLYKLLIVLAGMLYDADVA